MHSFIVSIPFYGPFIPAWESWGLCSSMRQNKPLLALKNVSHPLPKAIVYHLSSFAFNFLGPLYPIRYFSHHNLTSSSTFLLLLFFLHSLDLYSISKPSEWMWGYSSHHYTASMEKDKHFPICIKSYSRCPWFVSISLQFFRKNIFPKSSDQLRPSWFRS